MPFVRHVEFFPRSGTLQSTPTEVDRVWPPSGPPATPRRPSRARTRRFLALGGGDIRSMGTGSEPVRLDGRDSGRDGRATSTRSGELERRISPDPPVAVGAPMLLQSWRDVSFLHWALPPDVVRPHVPRGFELDLAEGSAWVSLISFSMPKLRPGPLPPIPGLSSAIESHLRTYVLGPDGRRGIWMLSLDMSPIAAAVLGRFVFVLPYWPARMEVSRRDDMVRYRTQRRLGPPAMLDLRIELAREAPDAELTNLDHFLTARWVLYAGAGPVLTAMPTEHPRWRFRGARVGRLRETTTRETGLPAMGEPDLVHFSDGVDARIAWPRIHLP